MTAYHELTRKFPRAQLAIHRRCLQDPEFRAICEDYEDAAAALAKWKTAEGNGTKVTQYRELLSDLEQELLEKLGDQTIKPDTGESFKLEEEK